MEAFKFNRRFPRQLRHFVGPSKSIHRRVSLFPADQCGLNWQRGTTKTSALYGILQFQLRDVDGSAIRDLNGELKAHLLRATK